MDLVTGSRERQNVELSLTLSVSRKAVHWDPCRLGTMISVIVVVGHGRIGPVRPFRAHCHAHGDHVA